MTERTLPRYVGLFNPVIVQGMTYDQQLTRYLKDPDTGILTPIDITGFTFEMMARETVDSADAILSVGTDDGTMIIVDGPNGIFGWDIDSSVTELLTPGSYVYDCFVTDLALVRKPFLAGTLTVIQAVTRG